jgi:serine/threonine protein kinase
MPPPDQIGKYSLVGIAGEGNMATVYIGHDPFNDTQVAIKVCKITQGSSYRLARKLFFNEAHTAGGLDHPNILSILDAGEHDGSPYIVMEYVDGADTLRSHVAAEQLLPLQRVAEILYQCAKALDYAHRRGVVHRDIKPSNIMLTRDGAVKIGDFGIAQRALSDETQVMGILGSPRYMSPEQLREDDLTQQSDLFSLGIVGYELITGRPPFVGKTVTQLARNILEAAPRAPTTLRPDVPDELGDVILRALEKDLNRRYESAHEIAADLASLFDNLDLGRAQPSPQQRFEQARGLEFFNEFSDTELAEVLAAATWRHAGPGATIVAERSRENDFYVLTSGEARVQVAGVEIGRGECFGEMGVLSREARAASVIAVEDCTLLRIDGRLIEGATLGCQLRFSQIFLHTLIRRLAKSNCSLASALSS